MPDEDVSLLDECLQVSGRYIEDLYELTECFLLHMQRTDPSLDPDDRATYERAEAIVAGAMARRAPRARRRGPRPRRAFARRPRRPRRPRESAGASCGGKHKFWSKDPGLAVRLAWLAKNCSTGERARTAGPAVGGTLADARRAPGLWDAERAPESGATAADPGKDPRAAEAAAAIVNDYLNRTGERLEDPDSIMRGRTADYGGVGPLGIKCQEEGSTMNCFDPRSGLNRSWSVTGRLFTPQESDRFYRDHCTPRCDGIPIAAGAPPDAVTKVRRVQPRNPAVRARIDCRRGAPPVEVPGLVLRPRPRLDPSQPGAEAPRPCVPDTVIGVDGGMFGSGWYIIIRAGVRMLVPNPEGCGQDITAGFR